MLKRIFLTLIFCLTFNNLVHAFGYCEWPDGVWRECQEGIKTDKYVQAQLGPNSGRALSVKALQAISEGKTIVHVDYESERVRFDGDYLRLWGSITNNGDSTLNWVKVRFTVKKTTGDLVSRKAVYLDPFTLEPGETGYIDGRRVALNGETPGNVTLEYKVSFK